MDPASGQGGKGGVEDRELEELMVKSFIQIMMETEKTAEGKAEMAQAQENDRKRRETQQLQLQYGGDAVNTQAQSQQATVQSLLPQQPHLQQQPIPGTIAPQPQAYNHPQDIPPYPYQLQQPPQPQPHYSSATHELSNSVFPTQQQQQQQQLQQLPQQPYGQQQDYQQQQQHHQPQTYDPNYQLQLHQQQLHHQYQQQLIQLQQQQQQLQQKLQGQGSYPIPNNNSGASVPQALPQTSHQNDISANPNTQYETITHYINNNYGNGISHDLHSNSDYHNNSDFQNLTSNERLQNPTHDENGRSLGYHTQQSNATNSYHGTMTNSVSKLSNTDTAPIDVYAYSGDVYANPNYISSKAGPLGMSLTDGHGQNEPKIIVLDQSDNEVEDGMPVTEKTLHNSKSGSSKFNHVFPIDAKAFDRDMFKQEYVEQPKNSQTRIDHNIQHVDYSMNGHNIDNYAELANVTDNVGESIDPTAFGYPDIVNNPDVLFSQPSDTDEEQQSKMKNTNAKSSSPHRHHHHHHHHNHRNHHQQHHSHHQQQHQEGHEFSYEELLQQKRQLQNQLFIKQQNENQRQLNKQNRIGYSSSLSSISPTQEQQQDEDLERYKQIPSQLTSIMEDATLPLDSHRDHVTSSMDTYRTIDPYPFGDDQDVTASLHLDGDSKFKLKNNNFTNNSKSGNSISKPEVLINGLKIPANQNPQRHLSQRYNPNSSPTRKNLHNNSGASSPAGPSFKINVNGQDIEKRATRANILSRAEQLLDARRVQTTDKSDSSEGELSQGRNDDGYDEEDNDNVKELRGPRHRALKHVRHQYYDDTTSYNSSDEVLNSIRFNRHGPLNKAARRARLTSFNARLHKQRRMKASMRLNSLEDTDLNNYLEKGLREEDTEKEKFDSDISEIKANSIVSNRTQRESTRDTLISSKRSAPRSNGIPTKPKLNGIPKTRQNPLPPQPRRSFNQAPKLDPIENSNTANTLTESDTEEAELHGASRPRKVDRKEPYKAKAVLSKSLQYNDSNHLPPTMSDDDFDSFENDTMAGRYESRYEESKLRDLSNDQRYVTETQEDINSLKKGRLVYFFRNGDIHYKPKQVLISSRTYSKFETLLTDLSSIVETSTGVKFIFTWPGGKQINSIQEFESGKYYVCSSIKQLKYVNYGNSKEGMWKAGRIDRQENFLFQKNGKVQSPLRKPRILTIISNLCRDSREKLILNTNSAMNFEDILNDIVNMVNIPNPPVKSLFTERKPHTQVLSYSQLIRDFGDHDNFIACGEEMIPVELSNKRPLRATASSSDGSKKGQKKTPRYVAQYEDGPGSPTRSSAMTGYTEVVRQQRYDPRRRKADSIRADINGRAREFFPPTVLDDDDDGMKPGKKLRLDWVYGFRGRDVKQNLVVLPTSGELVYFVAAVIVLYDKKYSTQKHYLGHNEEVTCLTIHPNGRFLASGQLAGKTSDCGAHVRVWDGMTMTTYAVIGLGLFKQGIACLNFSDKVSNEQTEEGDDLNPGWPMSQRDLLMVVDDSDKHVMSVWQWQTEKMMAKTTTTKDLVVSGAFYPFEDGIVITYGKEHIHFWKMKEKRVMRDRLSGNFEDDVPKFVTSLCFSPVGDVITGDSSGAILVWTHDDKHIFSVNDDYSIQTKRAHKKSVASLCMLGDGTLLSGGGNEIKAWDTINEYTLVKERVLPDTVGHVRSIVPINAGGLDGSIYVSTTKNKVLEGSLQLKFKPVIQGHVEEVWSVESHPLEQTFVSAGHDQSVIKWSAVNHAALWKVDIEKPCTSISIDPKGRLVALGTTGGKVIILNSYNGIQLTTLLAGANQVNALTFSPDGKQLAVGTYDGSVKVFYTQSEGYKFFSSQITTLKHSNILVMHMDWSYDSKFLQCVLGDYDVVVWDMVKFVKNKSPRSLRDVRWATHNCPVGYSVIGPWHSFEDRHEFINVVARSQYRDLMAVGDNKGRIRLFKWPSSAIKAGYRNTKVYSSNVTAATFTSDDSYLITSGGNDAAVMQFSVLDPISTR